MQYSDGYLIVRDKKSDKVNNGETSQKNDSSQPKCRAELFRCLVRFRFWFRDVGFGQFFSRFDFLVSFSLPQILIRLHVLLRPIKNKTKECQKNNWKQNKIVFREWQQSADEKHVVHLKRRNASTVFRKPKIEQNVNAIFSCLKSRIRKLACYLHL